MRHPTRQRTLNASDSDSDRRPCTDCGSATFCAMRRFGLDHIEGLASQQPPVPAGTQLFRQGNEIESLFIVRAGAVKTLRVAPAGTEQITAFYLPGDLFGLDALAAGRHAESPPSRSQPQASADSASTISIRPASPAPRAQPCAASYLPIGQT